ncbi:SRPBCC family protein [Luteibacter yeojuensis]|uniref:ATPase n=1 Tax=Luteibacter yeojuensis TaxID=345309 RepID=A0A0F3KWW5_9GAMM|nr:SRPBCC family protein [Luteibacter yeojuensis]KJV35708.1 ATPase [Luteibacter yeojuensis]
MATENADSAATRLSTVVERMSDRELIVRRTFNAPVHLVFEAWSTPDLFKSWWVPASAGLTLLSCDMDIRTGGTYRLVFKHPASGEPMAFFGTYQEVTPNKRLVWTNEESPDGAVTTVTFEERDGKTFLTLHELYPNEAALEDAIAGSAEGLPEQFAQLDTLLAAKA